MNYFIDFEAAQYSEEIIEIGLVSENGDIFNHLINSKKGLTPFISNMTGITPEEYNNYKVDAEWAFTQIYNMIKNDPDPIFYCYGNSDVHFLKATLKNLISFEAKAAMGIMAITMKDFSEEVKKYFGLAKTPGLWKVYCHYYPQSEGITQQHRALIDAITLMKVHDSVLTDNSGVNPFPEYKEGYCEKKDKNIGPFHLRAINENPPKPVVLTNQEISLAATKMRYKVALCQRGKVFKIFNNINDCARYIMQQKQLPEVSLKKVASRIRTAHIFEKPYMNMNFILFKEEE